MKYEGRKECVDTVPFEEMSRGKLLSKEASRQNFGRFEETTLILHFKLLPPTVKRALILAFVMTISRAATIEDILSWFNCLVKLVELKFYHPHSNFAIV